MKKLLVFALVMLPVAMVGQTTQTFFKQQGMFAQVSSNPDAFHSTLVQVSQIANSGSPASASILFEQITVATDFSSEVFTVISGTLPAGDFTGTTIQNLSLNLDTSTLNPATTFSITCTVDLIALTETCAPVTNGVISLTWTQNGAQVTRVIDFNEVITNGTTQTHIRQKSDNATANVSGTIFGASFSSTAGTVGINHDSSLEIIH